VARPSKLLARPPGLRELLHPLTPARFLRQHWTRRARVARSAERRMPALFRAQGLRSLDS
jgi:ribosomal protein L16 Arg81 hydroxylase